MSEQNGARVHSYSLPYTVRSERASIVLVLVLGVFLSLLLLSLVLRSLSAVLPKVLIMCMLWGSIGALMLSIGSKKIVLLPDRICYRTLFSQREILFTNITRVELDRVMRRGYRMFLFVQVAHYVLRIDDRFADKPLFINTKPFSKKDISIVVDVIATHAPSARLDSNTRQLREGTFRG